MNWAAFLGVPGDGEAWMSLTHRLDGLFTDVHSRLRLPKHLKLNRRGDYGTIASGYSHGQGQLHPTNFSISADNEPLVQELLQSPEMQRVARFIDRTLSPFLFIFLLKSS